MATSIPARPTMGYAERHDGMRLGNLRPLAHDKARQLDDWVELLARISHELRTPLNAVIGFSDAMRHEVFGPLGHARYQEYARHIRESGDLLLRAAEDTLAMTSLLAAPQSVAFERVQLAAAVESAISASLDQAQADGVVIACALDETIEVLADARVLPRALRHMIAACLLRAEPGGTLRVGAEASHGRVHLTISITTSRASDDAPVAASPQHERGLGREELPLWLARMLVELHGERMDVTRDRDGWTLSMGLREAAQADFFTMA